jgi:hypothetical protein
VNEKVGLGIIVANLQKDEVHMLAIRELGPPSELSHRLLECRASATHERADGDLVLCDGRRNTRIQPDDATMSWMRYHSDGTDASFQRVGGGHGESLCGIWASGSAFDHLAVSLARVAVCFYRNGHRAQICRRRGRREQASWRDRLLKRELESGRFKGKNFGRLEVCA